MAEDVRILWDRQAEWSQATFGTDAERGPTGPLKHLEHEAREAQAAPDDPSEYADCFLLILDAARRSGMTCGDREARAESASHVGEADVGRARVPCGRTRLALPRGAEGRRRTGAYRGKAEEWWNPTEAETPRTVRVRTPVPRPQHLPELRP
jgi:hypothetical protein